jgi:hypothetical protein
MFEIELTTEHPFSYNGLIKEQTFTARGTQTTGREGNQMTMRLRLKNGRRFFFLMSCLVVIVVLMASVLTAAAKTTQPAQTDFIVVLEGDTLWEIAETHCPQGDIRSYIAEVRDLNGLEDTRIFAGQGLLLPVR